MLTVTGSSLQLIDPAGDISDGSNWRASYLVGGSPGADDSAFESPVVINELLTNSNEPIVDQIELFNSGPAIDISGWSISDDSDRLDRYVVPEGTTIDAGGYLVLDQGSLGFGWKGQDSDRAFLLTAGSLGFADFVSFEATEPDSTIGRWPNGSGAFVAQAATSLGSVNTGPEEDIDPAVFDVTGDGVLDMSDVDRLCELVLVGDATGDLNNSGTVDVADLMFLIQTGFETSAGDANFGRCLRLIGSDCRHGVRRIRGRCGGQFVLVGRRLELRWRLYDGRLCACVFDRCLSKWQCGRGASGEPDFVVIGCRTSRQLAAMNRITMTMWGSSAIE